MKNEKLETRRKQIPKSVSIYVQTEFNKIDAKHIFIGEYLERNKKAFKGLEYGLEYLNKVADMEAKAERKWKKIHLEKERKQKLLNEILWCSKEVISTPLRGEWVAVADIKRIFAKYGIKYESPF